MTRRTRDSRGRDPAGTRFDDTFKTIVFAAAVVVTSYFTWRSQLPVMPIIVVGVIAFTSGFVLIYVDSFVTWMTVFVVFGMGGGGLLVRVDDGNITGLVYAFAWTTVYYPGTLMAGVLFRLRDRIS